MSPKFVNDFVKSVRSHHVNLKLTWWHGSCIAQAFYKAYTATCTAKSSLIILLDMIKIKEINS